MRNSAIRILTIFSISIIIAGCANTVPRQIFPEITFNHLPPIETAVSSVVVENRYEPPLTAPNAEHRIPFAPQTILQRWPGDRILAIGGEAQAIFVIVDARVLELPLDIDGNITAIFTNEQAVRYEASVEAVLQIQSNDSLSQGKSVARASRSVTVPENATLNEREQVQFTLIENTLREFDTQMELNMRKHLSLWIP